MNIPPPPPPPPVPEPTPEERQLQRQQSELLQENLAILKQQREESRLGREAFEKRVGMPTAEFEATQAQRLSELVSLQQAAEERALKQTEAQRTAFQKAVGLSPEEAEAEEAARQVTLGRELGGRFQKALKGELPVSPGLERSLSEQEERLREGLFRQVGPGAEFGDIGLRTLRQHRQMGEELREAARTGAISEAEQVGFSLSPALIRASQARERGAGTAAGLPPTLNLGIRQIFSPEQMETPTQLNQLYQMLFADRALRARAGEMAYQGALGQQNLLSQVAMGRAGFRAARNQAMIQGIFGAGGMIGAAVPWGSVAAAI